MNSHDNFEKSVGINACILGKILKTKLVNTGKERKPPKKKNTQDKRRNCKKDSSYTEEEEVTPTHFLR